MGGRKKIILTDSFARETISDILIAENVNPAYAQDIVNDLNRYKSPHNPQWFRLVDDDYKLYVYNPE